MRIYKRTSMRTTNCLIFLLALVSAIFIGLPSVTNASAAENPGWYLSRINAPENLSPFPGKKIVVAIVDDGIRTTHTDLREFIWQNPFELPGNLIDDDGNGQIDDINGWDVADNNNTVRPPDGRMQEFFHGTHLAGIIAQIARTAYGPGAAEAIAIMPVKSLSDNAADTSIKNGYKGIEYAVRAGADIILCAWGVGHLSGEEEKILRTARDKGVLIIASAGNFPEENEQYPAADSTVFAVTALDRDNNISHRANYGTFVDLSAPGVDIVSASAISDEAFATHEGTSQAAAIVAGAAAVMKAQRPSSPNDKIKACLKNNSSLLIPESSEYAAKQGAGLLNIRASVACLSADPVSPTTIFHPQGYLNLSDAKAGTTTWAIEPAGKFKGIWFYRPEFEKNPGQSTIDFYTGNANTGKPLASFALSSMPNIFFVPGTKAVVTVQTDTETEFTNNLLMEYRAESIKFRSLYCRDTVNLSAPGNFEDGSGSNPYSANSDCKWLITAPEDKVIHFTFTEFDTEPNTDLLYFFNGTGSHEKIMAVFSGPDIPPDLYTWQNKVLVWFVTNGTEQGSGWKGAFSVVDRDQAKYPELPQPRK